MAETLEQLVDRHGLATVVTTLGNVCSEKSEHILSHWQDSQTARAWGKAADLLARLAHRL